MRPLYDIYEPKSESRGYWKRLKQSDSEAFEQLYRSHFPDLFKYGMTLLPNESMVKDAIQQLFEDLWKYRANICEADRPAMYLLKSLRNIIYKYIRESKMYANTSTSIIESYEVLPSSESQMIKADHEKRQKKKLRLLINDLPPRQREVILLIFFEECSYEEVSSILSMSVQSVYTLLWRSLSTLRKKYNYQVF